MSKYRPDYESGMDPIHHEKPLYQQMGERGYKDSYAHSETSYDDNRSMTSETSFGYFPEPTKTIPKFQRILLDRLKECLRPRGIKGMIGFTRQLKLFDTNGNGELDLYEFKQAISDYELEMIEIDIENLFKSFSHGDNQTLNINEFLETLIQPMNKFRYNLVKKVFKFLDFNNQGKLHVNQLLHGYDASRHPEVTNFKKEKEEVQYEFQESFMMNHNMYHSVTYAAGSEQ
jgi:Ca2+-binding EF-hand superfamily protein